MEELTAALVAIATAASAAVDGDAAVRRHEGAWTSAQLCSSPVWFHNKLYLVSSRIDNVSHFCVFDGATGATVTCPPSSNGHFFFSAVVDHSAVDHDLSHSSDEPSARSSNSTEALWVFGSAWDRAQHSEGEPGWGTGPCADAMQGKGPGCHVGVWGTTDPLLQEWTFTTAVTLPKPFTVANVGVSMLPPGNRGASSPGLPGHQGYMALEAHDNVSIAVNVNADRSLFQGWELLPANYTAAPRNPKVPSRGYAGGFELACPSTRYNPLDQYYYVFGGGVDIQLRRSRTLGANSWSEPVLMATGCAKHPPGNSRYNWTDPACRPSSNMTRVAPGYFTEFWASSEGVKAEPFLSNLSAWDYGTSDADFCDQGGVGPTRFIYEQNWQGKPTHFDGKGITFYQVELFDGNEFEFLSSFFPAVH